MIETRGQPASPPRPHGRIEVVLLLTKAVLCLAFVLSAKVKGAALVVVVSLAAVAFMYTTYVFASVSMTDDGGDAPPVYVAASGYRGKSGNQP